MNEGVPEWPPSPFRLLRALYDTWRRKRAAWPADRVEPLLRALAAEAPSFELPPARASHVRVFYRQGGEADSDKKLVFDPFVVVAPGARVRIGWGSLELSESMQRDLDELVGMVGYLGRAESLVSLRRADEPVRANCRPATIADEDEFGELVRVACVARPDEHAVVTLRKGRRKEAASESLTWFDALTWGSAEVQAKKLSDPPALRWVDYRRSRDALEAREAGATARRSADRVHTVLLTMSGKVRPRVEDTVLVAERLRAFAMGAHRRLMGGDARRGSPVLAGKSADGTPAKGHAHAYYLPWDRDGDGELDHVIVCAGAGFDRDELAALDAIRWPAALNRDQPLVVAPVAVGDHTMFEPTRHYYSATPFLPTRHYREKRDGDYQEWIVKQLALELERHGVARLAGRPALMTRDAREKGRQRRWLEYRRARRNQSPKLGYGFRIELTEPHHGPFAVGHGAHFGLGLFVPADRHSVRAG